MGYLDVHSPEDTAIVLIDYVTGFANMIGSQPLFDNVHGAVALAKIARGYDIPLVVTAGPVDDPRGPLYPQLTAQLGDHPVLHRGGSFDAFADGAFAEAVRATGRRHLVLAGLMTEGCVLFTALEALRREHQVSIVVDATGGATRDAHDAALSRLVQAGATQTSWLSFASEMQTTYDRVETVGAYLDLFTDTPGFAMNLATIAAAQSSGAPA